MALIMDKVGANMREVWSPTAANCFKRMKGAQLDALFAELLEWDADDLDVREFRMFKKAEKDKMLDGLFHDADIQAVYKVSTSQKARIDAWMPACF